MLGQSVDSAWMEFNDGWPTNAESFCSNINVRQSTSKYNVAHARI